MTLYYWQYQGHRFLEGTTEELHRFHMDYEPAESRGEALERCRAFLQSEFEAYDKIAQQKKLLRDAVPTLP